MTSFISEHTAEYFLIPQLCDILSKTYNNIVPLYFWQSREGDNLSKEIHRNYNLKLLAFFPRRPKLEYSSSDKIICSINDSLFEFSNQAIKHGIITIAGVPLISSILEFGMHKSIWFQISTICQPYISLSIDKTNNLVIGHNKDCIKILDEKSFSNIYDNANSFDWETAIKIMKDLRNTSRIGLNRFFYGDHYKPTYILMFSEL
jgi:hypothetical protein